MIAVFSHLVLGYMIYRYSPAPWLSFLVWNCMALYVFTFSALKQTLAMAFVMLSYIGISKKKPLVFVVFMALAGMMHIPALVFIPAYWLTKIKVKSSTFVLYVVLSVLLYVFRQQFVNFISSLYYEDDQGYVYEGGVGNRFFMLAGFALLGAIFRGFADRDFERMFHLMVVSAILQMLAGFDHVFTRMSDYYFQFSVLYIPMTFVAGKRTIRNRRGAKAVLPFNKRSMKLLTAMIAVFMIWFYWKYSIGVDVAYSVDDYTNFRFMWDVK